MQQLNPCVAVDILVYTPEEFAKMQNKPNSFVRNILGKRRLFMEKNTNDELSKSPEINFTQNGAVW